MNCIGRNILFVEYKGTKTFGIYFRIYTFGIHGHDL